MTIFDIISRDRAHDSHGVLFAAPKPRLIFLTAAQLARSKPRLITPERREESLARYQFDHDAISNHWDPIGVTEDLVAATGDPGWSQRRACKPCYDWDAGGALRRPNPPRADDPAEGCHGCTWSFLDGTDPEALRMVERLGRLRALVSSWTKQLSTWRGQCVALVYVRPGKWVEVPQHSSYLRWSAKKKEIAAARKLIDRYQHDLQAEQKEERQGKPRGLVRHERFAANQPVRHVG
jgi:hypothetical protein